MKASEIKEAEFYSTFIFGEPCVIFVVFADFRGENPSGKFVFWNVTKKMLDSFTILSRDFMKSLVLIEDVEELKHYRKKIMFDFFTERKRTFRSFSLIPIAIEKFDDNHENEIKKTDNIILKSILQEEEDSLLVPENRFDKTYLALKYLIEVSEDFQINHGKEFHCSPKQYAKEFCTIRAMTSRRGGHTFAILKLIKEKFNKVVFLGINQDISEIVKDEARKLETENKIFFATHNNFHGLVGGNFEAVFIDCSWSLSKKQIEDIYDVFIPTLISSGKPYFFVFVQ